MLLYAKDGTSYAASEYWLAGGKLHYTMSSGGEGALDMDQLDLQRTEDENAKRGVKFVLKPAPNSTGPASGPTSSSETTAAGKT